MSSSTLNPTLTPQARPLLMSAAASQFATIELPVRHGRGSRWTDQEPELALALDCLFLAPEGVQRQTLMAFSRWLEPIAQSVKARQHLPNSDLDVTKVKGRRRLEAMVPWGQHLGILEGLSRWHHRQAGRFLLSILSNVSSNNVTV